MTDDVLALIIVGLFGMWLILYVLYSELPE